jgi:NAD(P)-dependent dehydrogenase (short-subunit alcohol dehydrogenase family)
VDFERRARRVAREQQVVDILGYPGKRVIVSGCFSGMGEATARMLLDLGAEVHGLDYKESSLPLASFRKIDLREPSSVDEAVDAIGGRVDALFNCAGLPQTFPPLEVMKVNFLGTRHLTERVLRLMGEGGAIVSISSNGGLGWSRRVPVIMELLQTKGFEAGLNWCEERPDVVREGYSFSKEAVIVWTMLVSNSLIKQGIRINCTMPSPTQTPMMKEFESATAASVLEAATAPINRRSTPAEQAGPLILLNSDAASFVNGVLLPVDAGFMGGLATGQIDLSKMMGAAAA